MPKKTPPPPPENKRHTQQRASRRIDTLTPSIKSALDIFQMNVDYHLHNIDEMQTELALIMHMWLPAA
jgi:hypothetical protein